MAINTSFVTLPEDAIITESASFTFGSHHYVRQKEIQLLAELKRVPTSVRYLRFYCDRLIAGEHVGSNLTVKLPEHVVSLHIFARSFLADEAVHPDTITFEPTVDSEQCIQIFSQDAPVALLASSGCGNEKLVALFHSKATCVGDSVTVHEHIGVFTAAKALNVEAIPDLFNLDVKELVIDNAKIIDLNSVAQATSADVLASSETAYAGRAVYISRAAGLRADFIRTVSAAEAMGPSVGDLQAFGSDMRELDNLYKLMMQLFSWACGDIFSQDKASIDKAIGRLRFIIRCAGSSPRLSSLAADAQKLLDRVELPNRFPGYSKDTSHPRYYVPQLVPKRYTSKLDNRIKSFEGVEEQIVRLQDQQTILNRFDKLDDGISNVSKQLQKTEAHITQILGTVLQEMGKNMDGFIDSEGNQRAVVEAVADCEMKRRDMQSYVQATRDRGAAFNTGVTKYQKEKNKEFWMEMGKAGAELAFVIGVAIFTCGAAAPLAAGSVAKTAGAVANTASKMSKFKDTLKKLAETAAKLLPKLQEAYKSQSDINVNLFIMDNSKFRSLESARNAVASVVEKRAAANAAQTLAMDASATIDYLDILADWDEYDLRVDAMFAELQAELGAEGKIDGMSEYRLSLKDQTIRGKTLVAAMRNVQERTQLQRRQEAERQARARRCRELEALGAATAKSSSSSGSTAATPTALQVAEMKQRALLADQLLRRSLFATYRELQRDLLVRFHQCLLSVVYHRNSTAFLSAVLGDNSNNNNNNSLGLRVDTTPAAYRSMLALLDDAADHGARPSTKPAPLVLSTAKWAGDLDSDSRVVFERGWQKRLRDEGKLHFRIPHGSIGATKGWSRLRIEGVSAQFKGLRRAGAVSADGAGGRGEDGQEEEEGEDSMRAVQWMWEIGPQFLDRGPDGRSLEYYMAPQRLRQTGGKGKWVDKDNEFSEPSLFCRGRIVFLDVAEDDGPEGFEDEGVADLEGRGATVTKTAAGSRGPVRGVDFSGVTEVKLSFKCTGE